MRFAWVATYATPAGSPGRRSGTVRAASMDAARSKLRERFTGRRKLDIIITATTETPHED